MKTSKKAIQQAIEILKAYHIANLKNKPHAISNHTQQPQLPVRPNR